MTITSDQLKRMIVGPDTTILHAVALLAEQLEGKILMITGADDRLLGVMTDYDVRQSILDHVPFERSVSTIMNTRPIVAPAGTSDDTIIEIMQRMQCTQVPLVDDGGRLTGVRFAREFASLRTDHQHQRIAVVMAGGFGTRLHPLTVETPKPLLHVDGRPILFIILDQIFSEGFDRVYLTLHYRADDIINAVSQVGRYRNRVEFLVEPSPLGTAGALSLLQDRPHLPFLVINADLLTSVPLQEFLRYHGLEKNMVTIATKLETFNVPYGVVELNGSRVMALREKPSYRLFVNTGAYVLDPAIFDLIEPGAPLDMPDLLNRLMARGDQVGSFPVHEYWLDIGTREQYQKAQMEFSRQPMEPAS